MSLVWSRSDESAKFCVLCQHLRVLNVIGSERIADFDDIPAVTELLDLGEFVVADNLRSGSRVPIQISS